MTKNTIRTLEEENEELRTKVLSLMKEIAMLKLKMTAMEVMK
jgi:predicted RNase H-like nuclease (RuvC/YqgF family)